MKALIFLGAICFIFAAVEIYLPLINSLKLKNLSQIITKITVADLPKFSKMDQFTVVMQLPMVIILVVEIAYSQKKNIIMI